jgi:hypothetical protein
MKATFLRRRIAAIILFNEITLQAPLPEYVVPH